MGLPNWLWGLAGGQRGPDPGINQLPADPHTEDIMEPGRLHLNRRKHQLQLTLRVTRLVVLRSVFSGVFMITPADNKGYSDNILPELLGFFSCQCHLTSLLHPEKLLQMDYTLFLAQLSKEEWQEKIIISAE